MREKIQLQVFVLFLFLFSTLALSTASFAAVVVQPLVAGYTPSAAKLSTFGMTSLQYLAAESAYGANGSINILGRPLTIPAKIPLAANAASVAKTAMRLNPTLIVGTMAAGWLLEQGLEYLNGEWSKADNSNAGETYYAGYMWGNPGIANACQAKTCSIEDALDAFAVAFFGAGTVVESWVINGTPSSTMNLYVDFRKPNGYLHDNFGTQLSRGALYTGPGRTPATQSDFDNLPDPSDAVKAELPSAPYMQPSGGVPVGKPEYATGNYPVGSPYKAPDGSTVQPMASVTNITNTNTVNVSTYNVTTHNAAGEPVANPTPEPTDEKPDDCELHPERVGCMDTGELPEAEAMPKTEVPITFSPVSIASNATCPAPAVVSGFGQTMTLEYDSACTVASGMRPVVLAVGFLTALFIIFGTPKTS